MLSERKKALLRIQFERELYDVISHTFYKEGLESVLFLLKESSSLISEFASRYANEFESILLSEQKGNSN
jgi:hypothetical protein